MGTAAPVGEAHLETTSAGDCFVLDEADGHGAIETGRWRESNFRFLGAGNEGGPLPVVGVAKQSVSVKGADQWRPYISKGIQTPMAESS